MDRGQHLLTDVLEHHTLNFSSDHMITPEI